MRAVCGDKPHVQFGRGGLVLLSNQDLAFYLTSALEKVQHMAKGSRIDGSSTGRRARCTFATTEELSAAVMWKSIWKATCMEIVHAWFGEGRMKKGQALGTSSAAYSTALPPTGYSSSNTISPCAILPTKRSF